MQSQVKTAQEAFIQKVNEGIARLNEITEEFENHLSVEPDTVDWGHVGTVASYVEKLTEIADRLCRRGEYAEGGA